jgi:hypothetical protein
MALSHGMVRSPICNRTHKVDKTVFENEMKPRLEK